MPKKSNGAALAFLLGAIVLLLLGAGCYFDLAYNEFYQRTEMLQVRNTALWIIKLGGAGFILSILAIVYKED